MCVILEGVILLKLEDMIVTWVQKSEEKKKTQVVIKTVTHSYNLQISFWWCQVHGLRRANGKVIVESLELLALLIKMDKVRTWVDLNLKVKVKWYKQL